MAETIVLPPEVKRTILFRQIGVLVAIAASVAIGVYVVLWSQTPNYSLLYGNLTAQDAGEVLEVLQQSGIEYRLDESTGAIMVPSSKIYDARMNLASENLPRSANMGFSMLQEQQKMGTSQFIEQARYQHALETELARTIEKVSAIRSARVHLAIPKQSTFVRNQKQASASVMLDIYNGRQLESNKIAAIANMIAASVPNLDSGHVSIVDQSGHLLTQENSSKELIMSNNQFQYGQKIEESYIKRIEDILTPIVGIDGVKAQVTAEFDFTSTEQTREIYNPDLPALRSEQLEEQQRKGGSLAGGIPGALTNQPPADAAVPEVAATLTATAQNQSSESSSQRRSTRNYEIDKTISHTRMPVGSLRRLSVAVLLDNKRVFDSNGNPGFIAHSPEELEQITALVKEAIGYNSVRGDTVSVMNAEFTRPGPIEALPETPIWKEPLVWDIAKQVIGGLFVLFLIFGVLRPVMKNLMNKEINLHQQALAGAGAAQLAAAGGVPQLGNEEGSEQLKAISGYESNLAKVKGVVNGDPKLAAQVVKNWVGED